MMKLFLTKEKNMSLGYWLMQTGIFQGNNGLVITI